MASGETVLVFDIETVPDTDGGRRFHDFDGISDDEVAHAMMHLRWLERGNDFLPCHLQRVVAISVALRNADGFKILSLGQPEEGEAALLKRFFEGMDRYKPVLVSWNGTGFDLPVLHYRSLIHGISAPTYWDTGRLDRDAKWDNYLKRYEFRHTDLMDVLSGYNGRTAAKLDEIALLLGFPGKLGMDGSKVWEAFRSGRIAEIRNYCETDVLNTYLIYLRFQRLRGLMDKPALEREEALVRECLEKADQPHLREFLDAWKA